MIQGTRGSVATGFAAPTTLETFAGNPFPDVTKVVPLDDGRVGLAFDVGRIPRAPLQFVDRVSP